jgi:hypothetical protein
MLMRLCCNRAFNRVSRLCSFAATLSARNARQTWRCFTRWAVILRRNFLWISPPADFSLLNGIRIFPAFELILSIKYFPRLILRAISPLRGYEQSTIISNLSTCNLPTFILYTSSFILFLASHSLRSIFQLRSKRRQPKTAV